MQLREPGVRCVTLEGCFNFRDLGGYRAAGGRVRWRRLFRADSLARLSVEDLGVVSRLGIVTVVDLRTAEEVEQRGAPAWAEPLPAYHHIPIIEELPPSDEYAEWSKPRFVAERYARMLDRADRSVAEVLAVLSDTNSYPAVFHCAAGKDRTGIVSAVVLGMLGVGEDDIVADYALSGVAGPRMLERLLIDHPEAQDEIEILAPAIAAAHPETMRSFLEMFLGEHASFTAYAASLGVPDAPQRLREALLET